MYAQRAWSGKTEALQSLRMLTPLAARLLETPTLFDVVQDFLNDVLTNYPAFLLAHDYKIIGNLLCTPSLKPYASNLNAGDFDADSLAFGRLLLAFGDATVQDISTSTEDPLYEQIRVYLVGLLMCNGYAVVEDEICAQALEFWITYVEFLTDALFETDDSKPPWVDHAKDVVKTVLAAALAKARVPPATHPAFGDAEARVGFTAFRADVEDLIQSSFNLFGIELLEGLVKSVLGCLVKQSWYDFEASLFCVNALADAVTNIEGADPILLELFNSSAFTIMASEVASIPAVVERQAFAMISRFTWFFERHQSYLPGGLNFLFGALRSPNLASAASKSIFGMCSSCRKFLTSEIDAFLRQYETLFFSGGMDSTTKERLSGAIAAVIQALPSEEAKLAPLDRLLKFVEADVEAAIKLQDEGQKEEAYMKALCTLKCLVSMGKGFQIPDEVTIELDTDSWKSSLWKQETGSTFQHRITRCYSSILSRLGDKGDLIEATCQILRTGYTETKPGPFVLSPKDTRDFFLLCEASTERIDYVLETVGVMLSRQVVADADDMTLVATEVFHRALEYVVVLKCGSDTVQTISPCL